jgi:hypothetical protein
LLAGFCTRLACVVGAGFLLLFYLSMLPWPGVPENLKAEGHYLYVNKNLIEMLALLALATLPTGRWVGLDAWIGSLWDWLRSPQPAPALASPTVEPALPVEKLSSGQPNTIAAAQAADDRPPAPVPTEPNHGP